MSGLRWGIQIQDAADPTVSDPLSAAVLDEMANKEPGDLEDAEHEILEAIRKRARLVVDAGVAVSLETFQALSYFEMIVLEEAASRRRAIDLASMAAAFGHKRPETFLPDTDAEFVRRKAMSDDVALFDRMVGRGGSENP